MPEIADGLVEIRGVAREPGYRSKIAVESHVQGVDPVGACVGPRGSRVRMVVSELRGEKIDIIPWNPEPARFVAKALSPARVREVLVDDETMEATVVVPDDQLSLAIGKEGLNARLAARLTGWKVDIVSETEFARSEAEAAFGGGADEEFTGRCAAVLSHGQALPEHVAFPARATAGSPRTASWPRARRPGRSSTRPRQCRSAASRRRSSRRRRTGRGAAGRGGGRGRGGRAACVVSAPTRTCVGCGRKAPQRELVRFVRARGSARAGHGGGRLPGRGAYTCRRPSCFERAAARRAFARTLRRTVTIPSGLKASIPEE